MAANKEQLITRNKPMWLCIIYVIFSLSGNVYATEAVGCTIGGFDLTRLQSFNPWHSGNNTDIAFDINLCDTSADGTCSNGISVRSKNLTSNVQLSYGNCTLANTTKESADSELLVTVKGSVCPLMPDELLITFIYFKCGKTLGQPVYLGEIGCSVYFEWESIEFCTDLDRTDNEVPCSVYNNSQLIDLSPLTKLKGGYLVDAENNREFYINVCRDITPDSTTGTGSCLPGSGACRVIDHTGTNFGQAKTKLQVSGSEVKMIYTSTVKPAQCIDLPVTVVSFKCPERGGSKEPELLSDFNCNYQIEWFTEYACPQQILISDKCQLTMESHNIDIDLSPLTKPSGSPYLVNGTNGDDTYIYYLNICGELGIACGKDHKTDEAACQVKLNDHSDVGKILGDASRMQLRYSDGELSLTYKNGESCHTHFRRTTIINFPCKQDAAHDGVGYPVFREEVDCTYVFEWQTRYACINHPGDTACHVEHNGKLFDLSDLTMESGSNWLALADDGGDAGYQYYVNVCHDVLHAGGAEDCPAGAAICRKDHYGKGISLGSFTEGIQYDPATQKIFVNYTMATTSDHECSGTINTIITFICKPGDLESAPALVHKSADECVYQFEWYTAAACPMSHQQGTDCRVVDTEAGYSFDLSGLAKESGDGYKVSKDDYDYYINVCSKIGGEHCKLPPHSNAAVCQVKKDGSQEYNAGQPSQTLEYFNGVLNLTYTNGEAYNDADSTPRKTEIAFVCDVEAGVGQPEFLVEGNYTYSFKWLTSFACPAQPIECVAHDDSGKQYDLSSLSKSASGENWVVLDDSDPSNLRKLYINVCRPLAPVYGLTSSTGCDFTAAVCETVLNDQKESVKVANLGQAKRGPTVQTARTDYLRLEYTDGALCPDGGQGARYNTTVHFICVEGQQSRGPSPPRKVGPCSYEVIWDTSAACALKETDTGDSNTQGNAATDCAITDANYTYSLSSLKKGDDSFYTAQTLDKTRTFRLNICGTVSFANCDSVDGKASSVCEVQSTGNAGLTGADTMNLRFTEENNIMLTYTGDRKTSGQQTEVQIELACNREADESGAMTFVSQVQDTYLFRLDTPVSCPPQAVDCVVQDRQGRQYDLSPLGKLTANYDVPDSRSSHKDLHYLINVCRPINEMAGSTCPGGPIGGCQLGGRDTYSLGYIQAKPHVADDGTITLRYLGGSVCHRGTPQQAHRSMRINFYCSHVEGVPEFVGESANCEYTFTWATPSACPQQRSEGSDCKVSDPLYNYQFDLNPLRKSDSDYEVPSDNYKFLLNVCGPLNSADTTCAAMGSCQTGSTLSASVPAGKANSKLIYDAGELSLVYDGGKDSCHGKFTRKTIITFVCDHSKHGAGSGPQYLRELEDCTYTFEWSTSLACPPHTVVDCTYTDPSTNAHYDLSRLAQSHENYVKTYDDISFIINICRSLVHRKGQTCPFNAAACEINATETELNKKYQSLGEVTSNPVGMEGGQLVIRYDNGATCSHGGTMSTMIILSCDNTPGAVEAGPSSHFVRNHCQHGFVWTTPAACPVVPEGGGTDCKAVNPATGYEFDLSRLKNAGGHRVNDREGHYFYINICEPVTNSSCSSSTGSCQTEVNGEERSFSAGNANARVVYQGNGLLMLNYSGGDLCHHNNVSRSTIINFVCHEGAGDGVPTFVDSSDGCIYYFDWHTELVCEEQVMCEVTAGKETFDLSPLIKRSGHHLAIPDLPATPGKDSTDSHGTFYINVCRPLNPIFNTLCPAGAAACRELVGQTPQNLGQARSPPIYDSSTKEVVLTYDHGEKCSSNPSLNISSRIIFRCQQGPSQGVPRLVEVSESCEYVFEWETNVVCADDQVEKETSNCTYFDQRTQTLFDLTPLKDLKQVPSPQGGKISIQACGALPTNLSASCVGAAVCLVGSRGLGSGSLLDGSYGKASTGVFEMDGERLKLTYSSGQKCQHSDDVATTNIFFECDNSAGNGQPEALPHLSCQLNFKWRTSLICPPLVEDCAVTSGDTTLDMAILSQTKESWEFVNTDGSRYWINLCQSVHGEARKANCPPHSAVCRHTMDGQVDMLGNVQSQNIAMQDDGTVVISYSQGTSACSSGRRRSNNPLARSIIHLMCGPTVGAPVLTNSKEDTKECLFEFTWKTRAVCKQESIPRTLTDVNQVIQDPRSGGSIDLRPLLTGGNYHAFDGRFMYIVNLEGHLHLDHSNSATTACTTAAVCQQISNNATYHRNLGAYASRQYYLNEDQLEVMYTSPEKCTGKYSHKNVTTIITFTCASASSQRRDPVFLYRTVDCVYLFTWATPAACIQAKIEVVTEGGAADNKKASVAGGSVKSDGINKTTLAAIVSIFSAVLVMCFLAVYFHKPERRAAAASRLKRLVLCQRTTENQIRYSQLAQMEEDPEVDHVGTNPFEEDDMENELQNGDAVAARGYHDDSDDDMLL